MNALCEKVHLFVDGELPPEDSAALEQHVPDCARCRAEIDGAIALTALAQQAARRPRALAGGAQGLRTVSRARTMEIEAPAPVVPLRRRRRGVWVGVASAGLAAAAVLVLVFRPAERITIDGTGEFRPIEARLPAADGYRRFNPQRGGASKGGTDLGDIVALERRGDTRGVITRWLLAGEPSKAREVLDRHGRPAALDAERAVIALLERNTEEALEATGAVLAREPRAPQSLWNRALVLRTLGLGQSAARVYEEVAGLNEPQWAEEARQNAVNLRNQVERRRSQWEAAAQEVLALSRAQTPPSAEVVERFPEFVRSRFYDAVRGARDARVVAGLAPLARDLDARLGGAALTAYVKRVSGLDFRRRGPLAAQYVLLKQSGGDAGAVTAALRKAGPLAADILLGLLIERGAENPAEVQRLLREQADPWLELAWSEAHAATLAAREAEPLLRGSIEVARAQGFPMMRLRLQMRQVYLMMRADSMRLREALTLLDEMRMSAQAAGLWRLEMTVLLQLAWVSYYRMESRSLVAYRDELLAGDRSCRARVVVQELVAERALMDGRPGDAKAALAAIGDCETDLKLGLSGLAALAELARDRALDPQGQYAGWFRRALAAAAPELDADKRLMASVYEARLTLAHDGEAGRRALEAVVTATTESARANRTALKTRMLALRALALDAVARGQHADAFRWLAAESDLDTPDAACVLGLTEDLNRGAIVVRTADGRWQGRLSGNINPSAPERAVPEDLKRALAGCPEVAVLAHSPFLGKPKLLGRDVVWWHYGGVPADQARSWRPTTRLVVSDVAPPPALGLPALPALNAARALNPDESVRQLRGPEANPTQVLRELPNADLVELHVHGVVDADLPDTTYLVLSSDERERFKITSADVGNLKLSRRPFVVLAACNSAKSSPYFRSQSARWSLPAMFLKAGARGVLATNDPIPDQGAQRFFAELTARIAAGTPGPRALRDLRLSPTFSREPWVEDVVLFQ